MQSNNLYIIQKKNSGELRNFVWLSFSLPLLSFLLSLSVDNFPDEGFVGQLEVTFDLDKEGVYSRTSAEWIAAVNSSEGQFVQLSILQEAIWGLEGTLHFACHE